MSKIIVTIGIIVVFIFLIGVVIAANEGSSTPGFLGLILFAGMIAGIRAVWKKPSGKNEITKNDNHQLDKKD